MKINWVKVRIFLRPRITDMQKQINGLSIITKAVMNKSKRQISPILTNEKLYE